MKNLVIVGGHQGSKNNFNFFLKNKIFLRRVQVGGLNRMSYCLIFWTIPQPPNQPNRISRSSTLRTWYTWRLSPSLSKIDEPSCEWELNETIPERFSTSTTPQTLTVSILLVRTCLAFNIESRKSKSKYERGKISNESLEASNNSFVTRNFYQIRLNNHLNIKNFCCFDNARPPPAATRSNMWRQDSYME